MTPEEILHLCRDQGTQMVDLRFIDLVTPEAYAVMARGWVNQGVQAVGGCCGLGVEHIAALKRALPGRLPG